MATILICMATILICMIAILICMVAILICMIAILICMVTILILLVLIRYKGGGGSQLRKIQIHRGEVPQKKYFCFGTWSQGGYDQDAHIGRVWV